MLFSFAYFRSLMAELRQAGYGVSTVLDYHPGLHRRVVLRHDVDHWPGKALRFARMEANLGIRSTYYFRTVAHAFSERVISGVRALGHDIGYHFEDLSLCGGNADAAVESFRRNLERLRRSGSVATVAMHGASYSGVDNQELLSRLDLEELGIRRDAYDRGVFGGMIYATDTGMTWNHSPHNFRDYVEGCMTPALEKDTDLARWVSQRGGNLYLQIHPGCWSEGNWDKPLLLGIETAVRARKHLRRWMNIDPGGGGGAKRRTTPEAGGMSGNP